jgi:hypothetical protein
MLSAVCAALAAAAAATGAAFEIPQAPQWKALGGGGLRGAAEVASIVAVLLACYVGQQNLHALMPMLRPYTRALCTSFLAAVLGEGGYV